MFGSSLPGLRSSINQSLLGSGSRHCYAIKFVLKPTWRFVRLDVAARRGRIACLGAVRTFPPCRRIVLFFLLLQPPAAPRFFPGTSFRTQRVMWCTLARDRRKPPRRSFPSLNLHRARVHRNHERPRSNGFTGTLEASCAIQVGASRGNSIENAAKLEKISASEIGQNSMDVAETLPS
jgi:hypothetical protein